MKSIPAPSRSRRLATLVTLLALVPAAVQAQTAYGIDATGALFSFNLSSPGTVTSIGNLGFTPDAIDFRPGTSTLYAVNIDPSNGNGSLFTVDTTTAAVTLIGLGFNSTKLIGATSIGFDFNPTTLQPDTSIRIRLTSDTGANLRLHSATGAIAATDTDLSALGVTGSAYTNTDTARAAATLPGTTLYAINSTTDSLAVQNPPNNGTLTPVGAGLGVDVGLNLGFDIYSGGSTNTGYLVNSTAANVASLYTVDLGTGAATSIGSLGRDFTGGFAIDQLSAIPEPASFAALVGIVGLGLAAGRRRRSAA